MKLLKELRRRIFSQGALSPFLLHSDRQFLRRMEDFNRKSDIQRMQQDLERVGADMHKALDRQVEKAFRQ